MAERLVYRVEEVAELLDCGRSTIYDAIARDELPGVLRVGRRVLISKAALHGALGLEPAASTELLGGDVERRDNGSTQP